MAAFSPMAVRRGVLAFSLPEFSCLSWNESLCRARRCPCARRACGGTSQRSPPAVLSFESSCAVLAHWSPARGGECSLTCTAGACTPPGDVLGAHPRLRDEWDRLVWVTCWFACLVSEMVEKVLIMVIVSPCSRTSFQLTADTVMMLVLVETYRLWGQEYNQTMRRR